MRNKKGNMAANIIMVVIGIIIAVTVIPLALSTITASSGNYTASQYALLGLVGLALVIGVLMAALSAAGIKMHK